ncbi:hypothetical protein [Aromatoleum sp.]
MSIGAPSAVEIEEERRALKAMQAQLATFHIRPADRGAAVRPS